MTRPPPGTSVEARLYDLRGSDRSIDLLAEPPKRIRDDQLLWVDVAGRDADTLRAIVDALGLRAATAELLATPRRRALLRRHDAYVHLGLRSAQPADDGGLEVVGLDLVVAPNVVMTVRDGSVEAFDRFREEIDDLTQVGALDAATFTAAIVDAILAGYLLQVEDLERRIDTLDEHALRARNPVSVIDELASLRGRAATLRRGLAPHRQAFAALARPDFELHEKLGRPWPGLLERLDAALSTVETARDLLIGTYDLVMTRVAQRTNDTVKTLTVVSVMLLPASLVSSVLGMNFQLPLFDDANNFWWAVGAMALLMAVTLVIAAVRDRQ
ncbi:MAG: CorA family divalent cation transporter [Chloroflexota bacterium]